MEQNKEQDKEHVLSILKSLRRASQDLQHFPSFITRSPQPAIESILELGRGIDTVLESDRDLYELSGLLFDLNSMLNELEKSQGYGLRPLIHRQARYCRTTRIALKIEAQAQGYLDKQIVVNLVRTLSRSDGGDEAKLQALAEFEDRVEQGFHMGLQELFLKSKVLSVLKKNLLDPECPNAVRERSGSGMVSLVKFNRNVFVDNELMGPTIGALVSLGSSRSLRALSSLVKLIRSPLIDEMYTHGELPRVTSLLESGDPGTRVSCLECVCEIAYFGRKEVVEGILQQGIVERLMELQRPEDSRGDSPFRSCVARFAVQVEVGEGLTQKEKGELKVEILRRVKEASASEAEAASIAVEVLWGSFP